ncbi:MAG: DUF3566 domain-containing protein [Acidimicrobiales bacterium]
MPPDQPGAVSTPGAPREGDELLATEANGYVIGERRARSGAPSGDVDMAQRRVRPRQLSRRERKAMGRLRARKVSRVVRHVDPWALLKISLLFYFCLFVVAMVSGVVLWALASQTGTVHSLEGFVKEAFAFKTFTFDGTKLFRASLLGGLVLVIAGAALNVLLCVLFNLISDLIGGIRVQVIEEETARRAR